MQYCSIIMIVLGIIFIFNAILFVFYCNKFFYNLKKENLISKFFPSYKNNFPYSHSRLGFLNSIKLIIIILSKKKFDLKKLNTNKKNTKQYLFLLLFSVLLLITCMIVKINF